jgi:class 3 adenylate cyclase
MPAARRAAGSTGNASESTEPHPWRPDVESLGLTDIIQLQNLLSEALRKRFTRHLALCFTDIVGSTPYVSRFGDEAGRRLQQRHFDALQAAIAPHEGRIVDTAGDGAFCCFFTVDAAAIALFDFFRLLGEDNYTRSSQEALSVRCGLHWGEVLTDGSVVSGEAVNLCSRVGQGSQGSEIRITRDALQELSSSFKLRCATLPPAELKGITGLVDLFRLEWQPQGRIIARVRVEETGEEIPLPGGDTISFGRFSGDERKPGNDVVLALHDAEATLAISRYHFELRRDAGGFKLRAISRGLTEVDGKNVPPGGEALVLPGSVVRVARTLSLRFFGPAIAVDESLVTRLP